MKIKAYTSYSDSSKTHYYREFEVLEDLPSVGEYSPFSFREVVKRVESIDLDCEQGDPDVWNYEFFRIETIPEELDEDYTEYEQTDEYFICVPIKDEGE